MQETINFLTKYYRLFNRIRSIVLALEKGVVSGIFRKPYRIATYGQI